MKRKFISVMIIALILTSAVDTAFIMKPLWAKTWEDDVLDKNIENTAGNTLPDVVTKTDRAMDFNDDWRSIFERKSQSQQNSTFDKWNLNDTNDWSDFAYADGNKTRLIVGVNRYAGFDNLEELADEYAAKIVENISIGEEVIALVFELPSASVTAFTGKAHAFDFVRYVEPSMRVRALFIPNDPYWDLQWGPQRIEADWAWNKTVGSHDVLVAVVDTGIDYNHSDLAANYVTLGYDWVNRDADPLDDFGHGTHCAGIITAVLNNGRGIAGLAQVRVMAEKVLDSWGYGYWDWVANGIIHATDSGADIISMSLGGYSDSNLVHDAVKYAYDAGVLMIAAAGNDNTNMKSYPAGYDEVIAVAATDQDDDRAWFSNWGDWIELAAPGVSIYSTMPTYHVTLNDWGYSMNYDYLSGTSMACPHVSGVAALVWSIYPNKSRDWVRLWLRHTADDLGMPGLDVYYGYGRINARKSVEQSPPEVDLIAYSWITPPYMKPGAVGTINATIVNFGNNDTTDITVQLLANSTIVNSTSIDFIASGNQTTVSLSWNETIEGVYNLTLYIVPKTGEADTENNVLWKYIYVGFPVKAVVLHSAGNIDGDTIANWQVLSSEWYRFGDKAVYVDYTTLNKDNITYEDIVAAEADVLIISCAYGWEFTDAEIEAIERYVHEGHGLIATAGTLYSWVPNNNKLAPLFGIKEDITWGATGTDLLNLLNVSHPILTKIPNPFIFPYLGTSIPSDMQWDSNELEGGTYLALGNYLESAVVTYRGLVYISPWLEVMPTYYYHHLQLLYNVITWSRYQRPEHDLEVSLQCPLYLKPGKSALLNATVANKGLNNETNVILRLLINDEEVANLSIADLAVGESENISYLWMPTKGTYNVTAYAPPVPGEEEIFNNVEIISSIVSYGPAIGFIETHRESLHSEELKTFYKGLAYVVITIRSSITPELLGDIDVLIVGEDWSNTKWQPSEIAAVQDFILSGGGFVAIGDELASSVQEILQQYGIAYTGILACAGSSSNFDHSHPIMNGVNYIYAESPINSLYVTTPGYWIANDAIDRYMLIAGADSEGYVLCLSDDFAATLYNDDNEVMFANIISWMASTYEHELVVSLKAYPFAIPNATTMINATVRNRGSHDEFNVTLQLHINGLLVNVTISELLIKNTYTLNYAWTPSAEGTYNVTAYVPPVENETYILNNKATKFVTVAQPLINPAEGQYANYTIYYVDPSTGQDILGGLWNFTYLCYVSPYQINITTWIRDMIINYTQSGWMIVNVFTRMVEMDSGIHWTGMWYPGWIETNVAIGSTINLLWDSGTIVDTKIISLEGRLIDCWETRLEAYGYTYEFWHDKTSGVWLGMKAAGPDQIVYLRLAATNIPIGSMHEHDVTVTVDAPSMVPLNRSAILNATVYNVGLSNEVNVTLQLMINGSVVASKIIPDLVSNSFDTLSYIWGPTAEGTYNVTAYVLPVQNEDYTMNNVLTRFVRAQPLKGYILFDQTHNTDSIFSYKTWIANLTEEGYVIETHDAGPITPDVLKGCIVFVIPQAHVNYTSDELSAIQNFVLYGGSLLVIGDDNPEIYTSLTSFAGIIWSKGGLGGYTSDITPHPVTKAVRTAYFGAPGSFISVTSPALGLIRDYWANVMLAASEVDLGKVIGIADEDSINDWSISFADNFRLAVNIIDWLVTRDTMPPSVTITSPANGTVTGSTSVLVQWIGTDNETGIHHYSIYLNNNCVADNITDMSYIVSDLVEGFNNVTVVAYDRGNNSASDQIAIIVDLTPPVINIISPANDSYVKGLVPINLNCSDNHFKTMTLFIDGELVATYNETGAYTYVWNTTGLGGQHTILLRGFDEADNTAQTRFQVIIDNTPPVGEIIQPANMTHLRGVLNISVYGYDTNLESIKLFIDQYLLYDWENEIGIHDCAWNTTIIEDGVHTVKLVIYDKAGNSLEKIFTVVVDNTNPDVLISSPAESAKLKGTVMISFSVTDNNIATVLLYLDNAVFNVTGQTVYEWNSKAVGDGQHVIKIVATDKAGNVGEAQVTVATTNISELEQRITTLEQAIIGIIIAVAAATLIFLVFKKKFSATKP